MELKNLLTKKLSGLTITESIRIISLIARRYEVVVMDEIPELSNEKLSSHSQGADIRTVNSITHLSGESVQRPLDASDLQELQQSKLTSIPTQACYTLLPSENRGTFTFTIRKTQLERTIERRERNDHFPDDVSAELVIAREASWIASTINNGQKMRRYIGRVSHDDYYVEVAREDSKLTLNIVFEGEGN